MSFGFGEYLEGMALLLGTFGSCIWAGALFTRRWLGHLRGSPRWLALATVCTATVCAAHLVPGALGILTRGTVPACAALILCLALLTERGRTAPTERDGSPEPEAADNPLSLALGTFAVLALLTCAVVVEQKGLGKVLGGEDTTNFQVPTVTRWLLRDSVWGLHQFIPDYTNATYPQNGNLIILAFILPFHRPFLAGFESVPYLALCVLTAYGLARELRAPRGTALLAAAAVGALPRLADVGLRGAMTDAMATALLGIGVLFLLRHNRTRRGSELGVAALALGLAAGTKWYGLSCAAAIVAVWAAATFVSRRRVRELLEHTGVVVGLAALAGGFWLIRNWVRTGNPLFPVKVAPAGVTIFDAAPDRIRALGGFTLLHYATDFDILRTYVKPAFMSSFAWVLPAFGLGALGSVALALRAPRRWAVLAVAATAALLFLVYLATPYSALGPAGQPLLVTANARYALPALLIAAAPAAWAIARTGVVRPLLELVLVVVVVEALHRGFPELTASDVVVSAVVVLAIAAACVVVARGGVPRLGRTTAVGLAAVALAGLVGVGAALRDRYRHSSYAAIDPVYAALARDAPAGHRIGVAGYFTATGVDPILPAEGPALGNQVDVLGAWRDHYLRRYIRQADFLQALDGGRYDLLIVGRGQPPQPSAQEERWAQGAGWAPVASSRFMVLLRRA
jgi:hypothetical protein